MRWRRCYENIINLIFLLLLLLSCVARKNFCSHFLYKGKSVQTARKTCREMKDTRGKKFFETNKKETRRELTTLKWICNDSNESYFNTLCNPKDKFIFHLCSLFYSALWTAWAGLIRCQEWEKKWFSDVGKYAVCWFGVCFSWLTLIILMMCVIHFFKRFNAVSSCFYCCL